MPESASKSLIFDVDGTLAETEDLHRQSFNAAFAEAGLNVAWDCDLYRELLQVTGGQRRILRYLETEGQSIDERAMLFAAKLHAFKNRHYAAALARGGLELRPGVAHLIAAARADGMKIAIATTTGRNNLDALLQAASATVPAGSFDVIVTGDDVQALKPDPEVYLMALRRLGLSATECLAFEDSAAGLQAAARAGIPTIVTPSTYTGHHDFAGAALVLDDLAGFHWTKSLMAHQL